MAARRQDHATISRMCIQLDRGQIVGRMRELGRTLAADLKHRKAIMGVFDEGCMGMYNAIIDDELLNPAGIYKERLSQSALVAKMRTVTEAEARGSLRMAGCEGNEASIWARTRQPS